MTANFNTIAFFGADHQQQVEVLTNMANEVGFKFTPKGIDYNLEYLPNFVTKQGKHEGVVFTWGASTSLDALDYYAWRFWSKSGPTSGAIGFGGPDGSLGDNSGDPIVDGLIEKGFAETDPAARVKLIEDLQKHLAGQQYGVMRPGLASSFRLAWESVNNFLVFQNDSRGNAGDIDYYHWWLDQTKGPFA
jgi:ABC-type transport system substrate-binding protein